jgi:hypothetical protein
MYLLVKEGCLHCEDVKHLDKEVEGLEKINVDEDYTVTVNGIKTVVDEVIREKGLPALITKDTVYIGSKFILEFAKKLKLGEL